MVEFEPHWADKLDLTIDREEYRNLLKRPSRHVKRMQRKQDRKYKEHEEYKQKYYKLNQQRADDIHKKIARGQCQPVLKHDGAPSFALPVVRAVEGVRDFITDVYGLLILICLNVGV